MRLLLDECVPRPLRRELPEHEIQTVQELGWSGTRNGPLLKLIKGRRSCGENGFVPAASCRRRKMQAIVSDPSAGCTLEVDGKLGLVYAWR